MPLIQKPLVWIKIYQQLMIIQSQLNFVKRDDLDFDMVNFPFLKDDVPRATSFGI